MIGRRVAGPWPLVVAARQRLRMRPVVGRLPVLVAALLAVVAAGLGASGTAVASAPAVGDVVGTCSKLLSVLALGAVAAPTAEELASGTTTTDRFLVGRPALALAAQAGAGAAWAVGFGFVAAGGLVAGVVVGASLAGVPVAVADLVAAGFVPVLRVGAAAALAGALAVALVRAARTARPRGRVRRPPGGR